MDWLKEENTYGYWYSLARDVSRSSLTGDYELMYDTIWPFVKRVYKKHYGELVTARLLDIIAQELDYIYNQVMESAILNRDIAKVAFISCVYAAEQWDFSLDKIYS